MPADMVQAVLEEMWEINDLKYNWRVQMQKPLSAIWNFLLEW